jgi:hypothetical protein
MLLVGHDEKDVGPAFSPWTCRGGPFPPRHQSSRSRSRRDDELPSLHDFLQSSHTILNTPKNLLFF